MGGQCRAAWGAPGPRVNGAERRALVYDYVTYPSRSDPTLTDRGTGMRRTTRVIVFTAAALGLIAAGAHAGLGGIVKSAKDKAAKVTGQKPADPGGLTPRKVQFDDTIVELTGPRLDQLIAARHQAISGFKERPGLVKRQGDIKTEIDALGEKHTEAITENENKRYEVKNCMGMAVDEIRQRKMQDMQQQMMANPRSAEKLLKLTAAINDAQMKGDTASVRRLGQESDQMFAATHADSLEAQKKCGPMPAPHPAALKIAALQDELGQVDQRLRDMDAKAMKLQADACGMPAGQVAMCWERITMYCGGGGAFTEAELAALEERKGAACSALGG